jgi:hypothetical protein
VGASVLVKEHVLGRDGASGTAVSLLITQRSQVQILPPLLRSSRSEAGSQIWEPVSRSFVSGLLAWTHRRCADFGGTSRTDAESRRLRPGHPEARIEHRSGRGGGRRIADACLTYHRMVSDSDSAVSGPSLGPVRVLVQRPAEQDGSSPLRTLLQPIRHPAAHRQRVHRPAGSDHLLGRDRLVSGESEVRRRQGARPGRQQPDRRASRRDPGAAAGA